MPDTTLEKQIEELIENFKNNEILLTFTYAGLEDLVAQSINEYTPMNLKEVKEVNQAKFKKNLVEFLVSESEANDKRGLQ